MWCQTCTSSPTMLWPAATPTTSSPTAMASQQLACSRACGPTVLTVGTLTRRLQGGQGPLEFGTFGEAPLRSMISARNPDTTAESGSDIQGHKPGCGSVACHFSQQRPRFCRMSTASWGLLPGGCRASVHGDFVGSASCRDCRCSSSTVCASASVQEAS